MHPIRPRGGGLVEVARNAEALPYFRTGLTRKHDALRQRDSADRDERNDVRRAHARMFALLLREVDQLCSFADTANRGLNHRLRGAGDGDNGAVVIRVERPVEQMHAVDMHRADDLANLGAVTALREVGNALYD